MKSLFVILISFFLSQIGFSQIQRIESGQYKFAKGEIEVFLVDTVSKEYAQLEIKRAGFEIISTKISPITFLISGKKGELELSDIENSPLVESVIILPSMYDSMAVEEMIIRQKMNKEEAERSRKSFRSLKESVSGTVKMHYSVTKEMANKFYEENKKYKLQPSMFEPRSVTVKTVPGKEKEAITELKKLKIVESVAYIALRGQKE